MSPSALSLFILLLVLPRHHVHGNAELEALMLVKASLDPSGAVLGSWVPGGDPCDGSFEGVACNEQRKVANISLQGKGLSGEISPAVAGLRCLSGLYLHYNALHGQIPDQIGNLTELVDLYLNVNSLSGDIPSAIGNMASLQVLQLCCNELSGEIPGEMGSLKKLSVLALQYNKLSGQIPSSLGNLVSLRRLDLSFNALSGTIPKTLPGVRSLQVLDLRNNSLSGVVPPGLRRLKEGFQPESNPHLCGVDFPQLRTCTAFDYDKVNIAGETPDGTTYPNQNPESANIKPNYTKPARFSQALIASVAAAIAVTMAATILVMILRRRRSKQRIGSVSDPSADGRLSSDNAKSASPLVSLAAWDPYGDGLGDSLEILAGFRFNVEEIETATQYLSEANLLGKSKFSAVYRGSLRDGSDVAVRRISITSCKSEENEFVKGLSLLFSLRHDNVVKLRGFCCSRSRNECFLVYDFVPEGKLSRFLDLEEGGGQRVLDWSTRVKIITGIAKGIQYLHSNEIIHQNISTEKILIDEQFRPRISDAGLPRLLADDIIFSALKSSAAMGYLAPEYVTTGRFTRKSDVYAFGVIVLQLVSGNLVLSSSTRSAAKTATFEGFVDYNLKGEFLESEAVVLGKLALACTNEIPEERPSVEDVLRELGRD